MSAWSFDTNSLTLQRFLLSEQRLHPEASGEFTNLMTSLLICFKSISNAINKSGSSNLYDISGNTTHSEEAELEVLSNNIMVHMLTTSLSCGGILSRKNDATIAVDEIKCGSYIVCFDPLDGSSNIDSMSPLGTVFGIYKKRTESMTPAREEDFLQPGRWMVAAGYCIYGSSTMILLSTGTGVDGFKLDPSIGEFVLTHPKISIPSKGKIYSVNDENAISWSPGLAAYIHDRKFPKATKCRMGLRYSGSMLADIHRIFLEGGIFIYPPTRDAPHGELTLLYHCAPLAFLIEQAGGTATTGKGPILHVNPKNINHRCPFYGGSKKDVEELLTYLEKE